jgi:hypothetical protein
MPCEHYKKALIEAAASAWPAGGAAYGSGSSTGDVLSVALREHLKDCAHCRATLAGEQTLFSAIDAALSDHASPEIPASFLFGLQVRIARDQALQRGWFPAWTVVAASVILVFGGMLAWRTGHPVSAPPGTPAIVAGDLPSTVSGRDMSSGSLAPSVARTVQGYRPRRSRNSVRNDAFHSLVPGGQQAIVDGLINHIRRGEIDGTVLVLNAREDLQIPRIVIPPITAVSPVEAPSEPSDTSGIPVSEPSLDSNRRTK